MSRRLAVPTLCAFLAVVSVARASGGESIASAPTVVYGQVMAGGGMRQEFWRMHLYGGDRVTFIADLGVEPQILGGSQEYGFTLYDPSVTDYNIRNVSPATEAAPIGGKNEFTIQSPFSGLGTLDVCQGNILADDPCGSWWDLDPQADPYSFTATVRHATSLTVSAPTIARSGASVTIRASASSPAGTPQGTCLIQKRLAPLVAGRCSRRIRLGHGRRALVHIAFVPDDGWQAASGHRTIHIAQ
jgi:hypothetical protein